jgi:predicted alpha/beta hydrolase family esterase
MLKRIDWQALQEAQNETSKPVQLVSHSFGLIGTINHD